MVYLDLLNGDCLEVLKDISSNTVDLFICDLPYGCLTGGGGQEKKERREKGEGVIAGCTWDVKIPLDKLWEQIRRLAKSDHSPVLMFCTTKFGSEIINSNPSWFRYDLVWDKQRGTSFLTANKMPLRSHEMIYVFSKSGAYYNRIDLRDPSYTGWKAQERKGQTQRTVAIGGDGDWKAEANDGTRCLKSVLQMKKTNHTSNTHPTEKPIELYKMLIERYCPPGGTILDPTAGSFNSCFAAYQLNRNSIGVEKDPTFYKKACDKADLL